MQLTWDSKVGPATVVSAIGGLSVLVLIGIQWGSQAARTDQAAAAALEAKREVVIEAHKADQRDIVINEHSVQLGKIITTLGYLSTATERIEKKLDASAKN